MKVSNDEEELNNNRKSSWKKSKKLFSSKILSTKNDLNLSSLHSERKLADVSSHPSLAVELCSALFLNDIEGQINIKMIKTVPRGQENAIPTEVEGEGVEGFLKPKNYCLRENSTNYA